MPDKQSHHSFKLSPLEILEASAGSGKTRALAANYLKLLFNPAQSTPFGEILAITFTNKASLEMKRRILEFLKRLALNSFPETAYGQSLKADLFPASQEAAGKILERILWEYDFFQVKTIDSLMNSLLSSCALHTSLSSDFRIADDYRPTLEMSFDELIDRLDSDQGAKKIFVNFLESYLHIEQNHSWRVRENIINLLASLYEIRCAYTGEFLRPKGSVKDLLVKKRMVINLVREILKEGCPDIHGQFANSLQTFLDNDNENFRLSKMPVAFAKEIRLKRGGVLPQDLLRKWSQIKGLLADLCVLEAEINFRPYIDIFNAIWPFFNCRLKQDNIVFLPSLNRKVSELLTDRRISVGEIYYRLATRFRHYLIDEFQDTSLLQWQNLFPLIEEALANGGSFFYVGDKKQAIYRFRGGNLALFSRIEEQFKDYEPHKDILSRNFRSQKAIVEFNNTLFSRNNLARFLELFRRDDSFGWSDEDTSEVLDVFSNAEEKWLPENNLGLVKIERLAEAKKDDWRAEAKEKLFGLIESLIKNKRFSYGDLAVLTRTNNEVEIYSSYLLEKNCPVASEKTLCLRDHPLIKEQISFLKFLSSPPDNLSLASFLTGEIFGKGTGLFGEEMSSFLFKARLKKNKISLAKEFRRQYPEVWENFLEEFYKNVGLIPLYEFMISFYARFRVLDNFPGDQAFLMKWLEVIKVKEDDCATLSAFLDYLASAERGELYLPRRGENAVWIDTIHKAKGLEFPVVILPEMMLQVSPGIRKENFSKSFHLSVNSGGDLLLLELNKNYGKFSRELAREYKEERKKTLIDELNKLYVAATRAKFELYGFLPPSGAGENWLLKLLEVENYEEGEARFYQTKEKPDKDGRLITLPSSRYADWIDILKDEFTSHEEIINRDRRKQGVAMHYFLGALDDLSRINSREALKKAAESLTAFFPEIKDTSYFFNKAEELIRKDLFQPFFFLNAGEELLREREIIDENGGAKRIDRLIIKEREVLVVDFKSSSLEMAPGKEQMREYLRLISSLFKRKKIKGYLVFLDTLSLEEIENNKDA